MTDLTSKLADRLIAMRSRKLSGDDCDQLARLLFDYCTCAYSGANQPSSIALRNWSARYAGSGPSIVVGGNWKVAPPVAALVNGTTAHSYELDDTHDATLSHPAAVVISAALAVAAEGSCTGSEFFAAIAAGYEAMARVGRAANAGNVIEYGFHPTALFGAFGAATAVAALKKFGNKELLCAWGHALSLSAGSMQFSDETEGTAIKRVHAGYAAQQGVLAAELAAAGVGAPERAIDGKYGFLKLYGRDPRLELLNGDAARLAIHDISFKPYACCRQFHSIIDGLCDVTDNFSVKDVTALTVRGPRVLGDQHMIRRPTSPMAAQYSLPYVIGATIEFGPTDFSAFATENLTNDKLLRWADLVQVEHNAELQQQYPEHFGSEVEVRFADGKVRTKRVLDSRGTPANPFTWEYFVQKAENLTSVYAPPFPIDRLRSAILAMSEGGPVGPIQDILGVEVKVAPR